MKKFKIAGQIIGLIFQLTKKFNEDLVLIWICDRFCLIEAKKAFVYRLAKEKGVHFESSAHFEEWYAKVRETGFAVNEPTKVIIYYDEQKTIPLYWV